MKQNIFAEEEYRVILEEALPPLLAWYENNRRQLPWREDPTPYHVWVSEIMLQQTRVEAVKGYYAKFMENLPGVKELASAEEEKLNKLWEGLGYYSRVRNLGKAARQIMEQHEGELPDEEEELRRLAGIGNYTAAAIASIAFGKNAAAVDGNILRVVTRLLAEPSDIGEEAFKKYVKSILEAVYEELDRKRKGKQSVAGSLNQAFMDLGSMVCLPGTQPRCEVCPMEKNCKAHMQKTELAFPVKKAKKERCIEKKTVLLIRLGEKILLHKRPDKGLLAGLYEFPCVDGHLSEKKVLQFVEKLGMTSLHIQKLTAAKHIFTHKEWHMIAYAIKADEIRGEEGLTKEDCYRFVTKEELQSVYAVPSAYEKYKGYIEQW